MTDPRVLLVHGAWHGGWCWDQLVAELAGSGIEATAVDLPSGGAGGDLAADVAAVTAAMDSLAHDGAKVLVVGHSYGGIPITQAAAGRSDVGGLVYVCAFQLDVGDSLLGALGGAVPPWIAVDEASGASSVPDPLPVFYADVDRDVAAAAVPRLVPQSLKSFADPLTAAAWHEVPSTYIVCTDDQAIPVAAQQAMAQRSTVVHTLTSSHSPFLSHTAEVAAIIAQAAAPAV